MAELGKITVQAGSVGAQPVAIPGVAQARPQRVLDLNFGQLWLQRLDGLTCVGVEYEVSQPTQIRISGTRGYEIHLRLNGQSRYAVNEAAVVDGNPNEFQVFAARHSWKKIVNVGSDATTRSFGLSLSEDKLVHFLGDAAQRIIALNTHGVTHLRMPLDPALRQATEEMMGITGNGGTRQLVWKSRLYEVSALCLQSLATATESTGNDDILSRGSRELARRATELLLARLTHPTTIEALANELGTNSWKLKKVFKAAHGATIGEYVRDRRLDLASQLLKKDLPVDQVAFETGYAHSGYFAKLFRQQFGVSPGEFRARHRKVLLGKDNTI